MTTIDVIASALCFIDPLVSVSYILLTALSVGGLLLFKSPFLADLASHGKTRIAVATKQRNQNVTSGILHAFLHSDLCLVPKKFFLHFYAFGLVALAASSAVYYYNNKGDGSATTLSFVEKIQVTNNITTTGLIGIMFLHLLRRCQECLFVHNWSSGSRVHVTGYAVGVVHYILLPHVFLPTSLSVSCGDSMSPVEETIGKGAQQPSKGWLLAALICLWAQYQQQRHHLILARLRSDKKNDKKEEGDKEKTYRLPTGGWFQLVSCPHYLAEIIIYISLISMAVLGDDSFCTDKAAAINVDKLLRYTCLLAWVVGNLTVSALENQSWYSDHIPNFDNLHQKAIFPFIL